ncbi:YopX family protein [Kaistella faecalis]|uniref:YopX family protein n=1 Tax=Kaistella faecalis TaxID=2852098 RepID=UPI001C45D7A8|nr:YopX family protein [Chryseobacterium faecale]UFK97714.1 YopX family protein [Chryseobacterium faecale]
MKDLQRHFTGIKDKNNNKIFVGDILRVTYGNADSNFSENELVICKDGKFLLDHEDGQSTFDSPHFSLEVIGTLKDNPELYNDNFRISFDSD